MTEQYLDVISFRTRKSGKKFPKIVGYFKIVNLKELIFDLELDAMPLPDENGRVTLRICPKREKSLENLPSDREDGIPF